MMIVMMMDKLHSRGLNTIFQAQRLPFAPPRLRITFHNAHPYQPIKKRTCSVGFCSGFLAVSSLLVADGVGQTAGRDESDQLDGGDTQRHPGNNVSGSVKELAQAARTASEEGCAGGSGTVGTARLREETAIVQDASLSATFKRGLDRINQISIDGVFSVLEDALEALLHRNGDVTDENKHQHGDHDLGNDQQDQEEAVGRGHAVRFANSTAASEEGNDEHDRAEHDHQDGGGDDVVLIGDFAYLV